ncbi:hypothetical protein P4S60_12210 [Pseudoalteromonas sp. Hal040]|uniref:hypothetical protein n=1 Tax=unclassified Pseudoalteromonas TaxID=194690 RepID=UPI00301CCCD4
MLDNQLADFEKQIDQINSSLIKEDFEQCESSFKKLDHDIRTYFDQNAPLADSNVEVYQAFYDKFVDLVTNLENRKKTLAKTIASQLRTKKKLDVYKSIK